MSRHSAPEASLAHYTQTPAVHRCNNPHGSSSDVRTKNLDIVRSILESFWASNYNFQNKTTQA